MTTLWTLLVCELRNYLYADINNNDDLFKSNKKDRGQWIGQKYTIDDEP